MDRMTYAGAGVNYSALDPFKRRAQLAGRGTADVLQRLGVGTEVDERGERQIRRTRLPCSHVEAWLAPKSVAMRCIGIAARYTTITSLKMLSR